MKVITGKIQSGQRVVVYGPEGIGKSTFASQFPQPLFIDTEGSTKQLDVARTQDPSSWSMLIALAEDFRKDNMGYKTLVIDTADWAEKLCTEHICATKSGTNVTISGIEDFGYGKGYTYLMEEFGRLLNLLTDITKTGLHVVITAHAIMRKFEQPDEIGAYDRWELKLQKKTAPLLKEWADAVLFVNYKTFVVNVDNQGAAKGKNKAQGGKRVIHTSHHSCWDAKNRWGLPEEIDFEFKSIQAFLQSPVKQQAAPPPPEPEPTTTIKTEPAADAPQEETMTPPAPDKGGALDAPQTPLATLKDLMAMCEVQPDEIRKAVAAKKYLPYEMPIENYPADFIQKVLVGAWNQVFKLIQEMRKAA